MLEMSSVQRISHKLQGTARVQSPEDIIPNIEIIDSQMYTFKNMTIFPDEAAIPGDELFVLKKPIMTDTGRVIKSGLGEINGLNTDDATEEGLAYRVIFEALKGSRIERTDMLSPEALDSAFHGYDLGRFAIGQSLLNEMLGVPSLPQFQRPQIDDTELIQQLRDKLEPNPLQTS